MNSVSGGSVEGQPNTDPETDPSSAEETVSLCTVCGYSWCECAFNDELEEFANTAGTERITDKVDEGMDLSALADWCKENNVPGRIAIELMKRAIASNESFIIY